MNHAIDIPSSKVRWDEMYHLCLNLKKKRSLYLKMMTYTISNQRMNEVEKLNI